MRHKALGLISHEKVAQIVLSSKAKEEPTDKAISDRVAQEMAAQSQEVEAVRAANRETQICLAAQARVPPA